MAGGLRVTTENTSVPVSRREERIPAAVDDVSIVIPIYNEANILQDLIEDLREHFNNFAFPTEILICENGSSDASKQIAENLAAQHANVRVVSLAEPSYGAAIKAGIHHASADYVFIFNADLWCLNFFSMALKRLRGGADLVLGSKRLPDSVDNRPLVRRAITHVFNLFLRGAFGFRGTDTHGLKALRRSRLLPVLDRCQTNKEVFDTELVLRAERAGLLVCEIPTTVRNSRAPRMSLLQRVPSTIRDLILIRKTL